MNDGFKSVIRHLVATSLSATWHLGCVSVNQKEGDDLLCMVMTLSVVTVGWRCVVGVVGQASWMMVVVEKERCGLLMAPKSSIGACRCSLWAPSTHSTIKRGQCGVL